MKHLILGGARSGKSRFGEQLAQSTKKQCVYIATGQAGDAEMQSRIAHHQQSRSDHWQLIEEPLHLAKRLQAHNHSHTVVLIDCLTLWLSNCMHHQCLSDEKRQLLAVLKNLNCDVFMISNEVGSGVVPLGQLSREFVDHAGWLHQALAEQCDRVTLVMAGLPLTLKAPEKTT